MGMKKTLFLAALLAPCLSFSQELSRQDYKTLEYADIDMEIGDFKRAVEAYLEVLPKDSMNSQLMLKIGICHFSLRNHEAARPYLEKASKAGEMEALYYLGQVYHLEGLLDEGIAAYLEYKSYGDAVQQPVENVDRLIEQSRYAGELMGRPVKADILNIGTSINTKYHEYVPLVYGADEALYFTSRRPGSSGGLKDHRGDFFEDVYYSEMKYGFWQQPEQIGEQINSPTHDACVGLSSDGQTLFIYRTSEDVISGDLYESVMKDDGWGPLVKLGSDINSEHIETSACISSDDRTLYFSSNRPGGFGGMDIYRVIKLPNGDWSKAINLGPHINTSYDEDSPFIHNDNKTLYFISKGHKSMGGFDIFRSVLGDDGHWSDPVNIGYPINSLSDDMNFVMSADKQTGYYSSSTKGGQGGQDIYKINFILEAKILSVVKGGVASGDTTHIPIQASITLIDMENKAVQGIYKSNPVNGNFIMVVTPGSYYQVIVEAEGYHTYSGQLYFDASVGFGSLIEEFKLVPLEVVSNDR